MTGFSDDLDDLFAQAKTGTMEPSGDLMARVLADAARVQPQPQTARRFEPTRNLGVWAGLAAVAGLLIGFVQPTSLTALADAWSGETQLDSVDLMPGIDALLTEE